MNKKKIYFKKTLDDCFYTASCPTSLKFLELTGALFSCDLEIIKDMGYEIIVEDSSVLVLKDEYDENFNVQIDSEYVFLEENVLSREEARKLGKFLYENLLLKLDKYE